MANEIKLKRGSGSDPGASDLSVGELAIRTDTAKLFTKNDAGSVAEIGGGTDNTKMPLAGGTFTGDVIFSGTGTNITFDQSTDDFIFNDGAKAAFGTGSDLTIQHSGNHAFIDNLTGNIYIRNDGSNDDAEIHIMARNDEESIVCHDDGAVDLYHNGSKKFETTSSGVEVTGNLTVGTATLYSTGNFLLGDNDEIRFGAGEDLKIYHNSSDGNSHIKESGSGCLVLNTNCLRVKNAAHTENLIAADENGNVQLYYDNTKRFETTNYGTLVTGTLCASGNIKTCADNGIIAVGLGDDLQIYHNGTNTYIDNHQGDLFIRGQDDHIVLQPVDGESAIVCDPNGAVNLYFDSNLKFHTTANGVQIDGRLFTNGADYNYLTSNSSTNATLTLKKTDSNADSIDYLQLRNNANSPKFIINGDGSVVMYDNSKLKLGNSADLKIYHTGSNSVIEDSGTGQLQLLSNSFRLNNAANSANMISAEENGAVNLFFNDSVKISTASAGINVAGEVSTTGHIRIPDNMSLIAGTGSDLFIYHDGNDNYIQSTGKLYLKSSNFVDIRSSGNETMIKAIPDGAVELYHNNTKRLETVDDGLYVAGNLGINRDGALAYGSTSTILEAKASDASNSIFESATFRGGADHNGAGARVRIVQGTHRGLVLEGGRTSNAAFGAIGITDQTGSVTSSVHIDSAGTWFWGKTSQSSGTPGVELYKDGPHFMTRSAGGGTVLGLNDSTGTSGGIMKFYFQDVHRGSLQFTGSTFQTATASDYRLKENDVAISDGITRLKLLRPIRFNWKTDASKTYDGFIAHEVTPVVPEAVVGEKDGEISKRGEGYQMICQQTLIPLLTAALKEAVSKIELLEARVTTLEAA